MEDEDSDVDDYYDDESEWGDAGVCRAAVVRGSKHRDGSIYRQDTHWIHRLYRLNDTRETALKPTNLSFLDTTTCHPHWTYCRKHNGCAMMQIFSLKLVNHRSADPDAPIQLYGFMAVRDLHQPLRNYVFNRTRDDPLIIQHDPNHDDDHQQSSPPPLLIPMTGPKRGIYLGARALIEFDLRIKRGANDSGEDDDLELIDGAATFSELTPFHGIYTSRIPGRHGFVDVSLALLRHAVEARITLRIPESLPEHGVRLSAACTVSKLPEKINLFDGVIDKPGRLSFVVAVVIRTPLLLHFKAQQVLGRSGKVQSERRGFPAQAHGSNYCCLRFDFGEIEMNVSWANLVN